MASSSIKKMFVYDVFLSFRGEDTSKTFVDHLYHELQQQDILTYKDDERIEKGEKISDQLMRSVEDSRCHIIVFSKNYVSSSWCLDELVKIMECQMTTEQTAYPVFYDVDPSEVRKQSGSVGEAFAKHVGKEAAGRWRDALTEAASLSGWDLRKIADGHAAKCIQLIVERISLKLCHTNSSIIENLVGMETRVKNVVSSLEIDSDDVRMIGIKGMGGAGKTTLARAVFDQLSNMYEGKSFVENVREVSKHFGLKALQKQVLKDVLNDKSIDVTSVYEGKNKMKKMIGSRKLLVVLDDVVDMEQLEALAGEPSWFKPGSRIIITTGDEQVLAAHQTNFIHNIDLLSHEEAIHLFSTHAFRGEIPMQSYENLSKSVVEYAAGLPLTIKVLGSFLRGKNESVWENAIERLKTIPLKATLEKLELSYDGLENDQKEIFLDVACMLKGETKGKAIRVLGLHAQNGLRVLEQKSMITISNDGRLLLHDHMEEMGKNIVRRLFPDEPKRHSRLWNQEEIKQILVNESGTEATRSIQLLNTHLDPYVIMKGLSNMKKLRLLHVIDGYTTDLYTSPSSNNYPGLPNALKYLRWHNYSSSSNKYPSLPNALKYLYWRKYPSSYLPKAFEANHLVNLEMPHSNISQLWEGRERKILNKLRFLDLTFSRLRTFNMELTPHLEELNLRGCNNFTELNMPIICSKLKYLNLSGSKLNNFNLGLTPYIEELHLEECNDLVDLHMPIECPKLKFLGLSGSKVRYLNLGLTPRLERLDLKNCYHLKEIHAPVGCLKMLVFLNLSGCSRFEYFVVDKGIKLPGLESLAKLELMAEVLDICPLHASKNLPKFRFKCKYDEPLSSWSGNLEKLISFGLCACTNLESFSASLCGLQQLGKLTLEGSIPEVPKNLYQLESLEELSLSMEKIKHLPNSICMLKHLKSLELKSCLLLEQLPNDIGSLEGLEKLHLTDCISLRDIPNSICKMKCLKYLHLPYCVLVEKLPDEVGRLECLEELNIEGTSINPLPDSIFQLKDLCIVWSRGRLESYGFTSLKKHSRYTASGYIKNRKTLTTGASSKV